MSQQPQGDAVYLPGYTEQERQRLIEQAGIFRRFTEQFLVEAGIGRGMRVLDVGCRVGDVTLLMAELVGPEGAVVGVDQDARALQLARERAAGHGQVTFAEGTCGSWRSTSRSTLRSAGWSCSTSVIR